MKGNLYFDNIEKRWYVNWLNNVELYPSVSLGGRIPLHPDENPNYESDKDMNGEEIEYSVSNGFAKLDKYSIYYDNLSPYSKVENAIIEWSIDGRKTAGELTRKILKILEK